MTTPRTPHADYVAHHAVRLTVVGLQRGRVYRVLVPRGGVVTLGAHCAAVPDGYRYELYGARAGLHERFCTASDAARAFLALAARFRPLWPSWPAGRRRRVAAREQRP